MVDEHGLVTLSKDLDLVLDSRSQEWRHAGELWNELRRARWRCLDVRSVKTSLGMVVVIVAGLAACRSDGPECDAEEPIGIRSIGCPAALIFAARDSTTLIPSQDEVDRYLHRWNSTLDAEPILAPYAPQVHRYNGASRLTLNTTNPDYIAAWSTGVTETGDEELDAMFSRIGATLHDRLRITGGPYEVAGFQVKRIFNQDILQAALATRATWFEHIVWPQSDGWWTWLDAAGSGTDGATAQIDFSIGWGDCFNGCIWMHHLRSIAPAEGPATVYDLGGDPFPEGWNLSPNTKPPPD